MKTINTNGEAFIAGKVNTGGGKFIKRDKITFEGNLESITEPEEVIIEDEEDFDLDEVAETDLTKLPPNVNTGGGKYIAKSVNTKGKDFVGRKIIK